MVDAAVAKSALAPLRRKGPPAKIEIIRCGPASSSPAVDVKTLPRAAAVMVTMSVLALVATKPVNFRNYPECKIVL
jgi:hypothetical protein